MTADHNQTAQSQSRVKQTVDATKCTRLWAVVRKGGEEESKRAKVQSTKGKQAEASRRGKERLVLNQCERIVRQL